MHCMNWTDIEQHLYSRDMYAGRLHALERRIGKIKAKIHHFDIDDEALANMSASMVPVAIARKYSDRTGKAATKLQTLMVDLQEALKEKRQLEEYLDLIEDSLNRLGERERRYVSLKYFEGATDSRVAADLDVSRSTVTDTIRNEVKRVLRYIWT